jgi:hypothetical protein
MLRFHKSYFLLALALLGVEVGIALVVHDRIIRPYAGDLLATILLYCLLRSFTTTRPGMAALLAAAVSYAIEAGQYFHLLSFLGWQHFGPARIVLGTCFEWGDVLAYTLGAALALGAEQAVGKPAASTARIGP